MNDSLREALLAQRRVHEQAIAAIDTLLDNGSSKRRRGDVSTAILEDLSGRDWTLRNVIASSVCDKLSVGHVTVDSALQGLVRRGAVETRSQEGTPMEFRLVKKANHPESPESST